VTIPSSSSVLCRRWPGSRRDRVVVDALPVERDIVVFEAGSHDRSVRVATSDVLYLTGADTADICREE
jgi:prolyl-tRNA editing enzyme YbaK/EbsC (Cys-tRNA(Pro) deacylase)